MESTEVTPEALRAAARAIITDGVSALGEVSTSKVGPKWTERLIKSFEENRDELLELAAYHPPLPAAEIRLLEISTETFDADRQLVTAAIDIDGE